MQITGFDGTLFSSISLTVEPDPAMPDMLLQGTYIVGGRSRPRFAGVTFPTIIIPCRVEFGGQADVQSSIRSMFRLLRPDLSTERLLTGTLNDNTAIQMYARPKAFQRIGPGYMYALVFEASNYWRSTTTTPVSVTGPASSGGTVTRTITTSGDVRALPKVTLTPQKQKTSGNTVYTLSTTVTEASGNALAAVAWTITFDHAAQVSAGNSTSAGTDIRVFVDGLEVDRALYGTNTSTCRVCFPLTVAASGTATVNITYAGSGQTYGMDAFAQDGAHFSVTERNGDARSNHPHYVTIDHASYVTASRSKASGADVRVFLDGVEVNRALSGANTSTCKVWFPLEVGASGVAVIDVRMSSSGYDFSGTTYAPGSFDLSTSTPNEIIFTSPSVDSLTTPGGILPILINTSGNGNSQHYEVANYNPSGDPSIRGRISTSEALTQNGNAARFWWGGIPITAVKCAVSYANSIGLTRGVIASSSDLSAWSAAYTFVVAGGGSGGSLYSTRSLPAGTVGFAVGHERLTTSSSYAVATNYSYYGGSGTSEFSFTPDSSLTPLSASLTDPSNSSGSSTLAYIFAGVLSDELGHSIAVANLTAPVSWAANAATLIDADLSNWTLTGATLTTGVADPDGGTGAYTLTEDSSTGSHELSDGIAITAGDTYTFKIRGKSSVRKLEVTISDPGRGYYYGVYDLSTDVVTSGPTTSGSPHLSTPVMSIESGGGTDWWSCLFGFTSTTATAVTIYLDLWDTSDSYAGDGASGVDLYDVELIAGTGVAGSLVIDASTKSAWLLDRGGTEVANSATAARTACTPSGSDEDWLALDPGATSTVTWTESDMDADGMIMTVEAADRWH